MFGYWKAIVAFGICVLGHVSGALGWGGTDYDRHPLDTAPSRLQAIDLRLADVSEFYPEGHPAIRYFISTNEEDPPVGTYSGDSGSPLLFWSELINDWVVAGVSTSGRRGRSDYANLAPFVDWIDSALGSEETPDLDLSDRFLLNFDWEGRKYIGFRLWPFAGIRSETIEFFSSSLSSPSSFNRWHPIHYPHWVDAGDGSFYILSEVYDSGAAFARLEIEQRRNYEAPLLELRPFEQISLNAVTHEGQRTLRHFAFRLRDLEVGTSYRLEGPDIRLFESSPGDALRPMSSSDFLAKEGYNYWVMTWTRYADQISLIPLPEIRLAHGVAYRGELTENSPLFRVEGTRVALLGAPEEILAREVKITLNAEFDGEFTVYNYSGVPVAYADQGAEFEPDELIIADRSFSRGSIAVHNFDRDATGSFELVVSPHYPENLTWNAEQYRGITLEDSSFRDSSGRSLYYESHPLRNISDYKYLTVTVRGYNFDPILSIFDSDGEELAYEYGSRSLEITIEIEPNRSYSINVISDTSNAAEYYKILVAGSSVDPRQ